MTSAATRQEREIFLAGAHVGAIAGACPMMYGPTADFGHRCMRWVMGATGQLPA